GFPTYFEMGVALAFKYFAQKKVDIAVVEVGMGGRFDATNILKPIICGITKIGFDHQEFLGNTLDKIAFEKAGIIKPKTPVVISDQDPEALEVLIRVAEEVGAPVFSGHGQAEGPLCFGLEGQLINLKGESGSFEKILLPLLGKHQIENASFSFKTLEILKGYGFQWGETHLRKGFGELKWPGRMEVLSKSPLLVIDGAHNPNKAAALIRGVKEYFEFKGLILILGVSKDKDLEGIIKEFSKENPLVLATAYKSERAFDPEIIQNLCNRINLSSQAFPSVESAIKMAFELANKDDLILATGSIYIAGEVRDLYFPKDEDP
ncbi:MAG: Mur ligase family protein, partial [Caldiserica bacterium]|nr:Mur ligase family protein [Caldisericota bacterium]